MIKYSNIIVALILVALLASFSYWQLGRNVQSDIEKIDLPVENKEFVWVRMDSLSRSITQMTNGNVKIDSTSNSKYILSYTSKQYLLHERIDGMNTNRKHLIEEGKSYFDYEENDNFVTIKLKRKNQRVFCPAVILGRVLYWRSKNQNNQ